MFVEHKEALEVTEAPAKTLKLAEAIRIGSKIRPQCTEVVFDGVASCAIGAAMEARGWLPADHYSDDDALRFMPELWNNGGMNPLFVAIGKRNDEGMTREEIADWLEAQGY